MWILPGISGFFIQMVSAYRHDWCTIIMGWSHFYPHSPPPPPLPKDDWHPHPRIFVGTLWKIKSKEFIFCPHRWYICPQGLGHLSAILGAGGWGGGEELTSLFSYWSFYYTFLFACLLCRGMLILLWNKLLNSIFLHPGSCTRSKPSRLMHMHIGNTSRFINWT